MKTVQGTAASWSPEAGTDVLLDDGTRLHVPPEGLVHARSLRAGQRVRIGLDERGAPVAVTLLTLPLE